MPVDVRHTYSATTTVLELDGVYAATLREAEGGQAFADVLSDPPNGAATNKHLGPVRYAPVSISFGSALTDRLLDWITRALAGEQPERDGAIVFLDFRANEVSRLEFTAARISDIELPRFDAGAAKETTEWTVVFQPTTTSASYRSAGLQYQAAAARGKEKQWLAASFRLNISGLESASAHVKAVEPIIVHQEEGAPLRVGNLLITVNNAALPAFVAWHEEFVIKGNNSDDKERSGTLVQLAPNLKDDLFTIDLQHIGIVRISPARAESTSHAVVGRSTVELYFEEVQLTNMSLPAPVPPAPSPAPPPPAAEPIGAEPEMRPPAVVAERLLRTTNSARPSELEPRARLEGMDAGERWAATTASLSELESLVGPGHGDWTELRLADDHSLADFLRSTGVLDGTGGPIDLSRDDFVDGLVAGAERVFREAQPHLGGAGGIPESTPNDDVVGSSGRTRMKVTFDEVGKLVVIETLEGNKLTLSEDATMISLRDQRGNLVRFGADGITIQSATNLTLKAAGTVEVSGAMVNLKAQAQLKADGAIVDLNASGPMTIKGSIVRIN